MDFYKVWKGFHWALKGVYCCFVITLVLIPFDAYFLPFKTGPITLYPYLISILLGTLFTFFVPGESRKWPFLFKLLFAVTSIWVLIALLLLTKIQDKHRAFYAVRSVLFLWLHVVLVLRIWKLFPMEQLRSFLIGAIKVMLFFLTVCGFFEYFTGIHIIGAQTVKILHEPIGDFTYAPMAFYDNPNNFMVYLIISVLLLFYLDANCRKNTAYFLGVTLIVFFFAEVADSKFGIIISFLLLAYLVLTRIKNWWKSHQLVLIAIAMSLSIGFISFVAKPLFFGPLWKWNPQYTLNEISSGHFDPITKRVSFISGDSLAVIASQDSVVRSYRDFKGKYGLNANQIRVNLNKNSIDLIKQSYGIGIGPGQYSWYYENGHTRYPTSTVTNPHNAFAEIGVEYGLIVLLLVLVLIFYWFGLGLKAARKNKDFEALVWYVVMCMILVCVLNIPSGFLNLNIGWWLLILLMMGPYLDVKVNTTSDE